MPATRRQYLRRRVVAAVVAIPVLTAAVYVPVTLSAPLDAASAAVVEHADPVLAAPVLDFPTVGASAIGAVGASEEAGGDSVLATSGSADPLPIASISKVVTALVVLDTKPLGPDESGPEVEFTAADVALYSKYEQLGGKVEPVSAGYSLSQRELLDVVLVASANNYAESLAGWAFGSQDAFTAAASSWLTANGLSSTTLVEPTGMSASNVSTATDLVQLGRLALANPTVAAIVRQKSITMPSVGLVENTNELLGISGVDGIKTGTLDEAGACLLFSSEFTVGGRPITVVGVVLGGIDHPSLDREVLSLLATVEAGYDEVTLVTAGEPLASYQTEWGQTSTAVASRTESVVVWATTPISSTTTAAPVTTAPAGAPAGAITFSVGGTTVEVPLVLEQAIVEPDATWRLLHPLGLD